MTEKRFYLNEGEVGILKILDLKEDNEAIYHTASKSDMKMVVELFNKLAEENKELKQSISDWQGSYDELYEENKDLEEARSYYQENFLTMKTERNQLKDLILHMGYTIKNENGIITLELKR